MAIIDSDAHVVESDRTWDFMDKSDVRWRPRLVSPEGNKSQYWVVNNQICGLARPVLTDTLFKEFAATSGRRIDTDQAAREMESSEARLQAMDTLGIDIQILYTTIFISQVTDLPEAEIPICWGWNRWMAELTKSAGGRLPWMACLPLLSMPHAIEQLRYAKENGAVGVFMRSVEYDMLIHDPYFDPLYEEVSRLDMCVGVHVGSSNRYISETLSKRVGGAGAFWNLLLGNVGAVHAAICNGLFERHPKLRMGCIEAGAGWVPYAITDLRRRGERINMPEDIFKDYRVWVSCFSTDDFNYIAKYSGDTQLLIGTDFGHTDVSAEVEVFQNTQTRDTITPELYQKIVDDNARAFYGL